MIFVLYLLPAMVASAAMALLFIVVCASQRLAPAPLSSRPLPRLLSPLVALTMCAVGNASVALANDWPQWRGPSGVGITTETNLPLRWSPTENVRWKLPLPERGNSTPVLWKNRLLLTQPIEKEHLRSLLCVDRDSGAIIWQANVHFDKPEATHATNPYCSASPVTDGERVIVWYGGAGLHCYDMAGRPEWSVDLGQPTHVWGYGASPILHNELCILQFGPGATEFVVAVDKQTGKEVWRVDLPRESAPQKDSDKPDAAELRGSWATPLVIHSGSREELILHTPGRVLALDPTTGAELWHCDGLGQLAYASPIWGDGVLVALGGYFGSSLAVKPGGSGDVTEQRLWRLPKSKLRLGSGVIRDGRLYVTDMNSVAECTDLLTNQPIWEHRLPGAEKNDCWSSMMLSGDRIYLMNQAGETFVFRAAPEFELLATNALGEPTNSSVVAADEHLYLRTHANLWCIGQ